MTEQTFGSKAQVWHGTAKKTSGGLTKNNLMKNKHGRIVSRRKHTMGKKSIKHLRKMGYIAKKGKFTLFHKGHKGNKSRKMRGGTGNAVGTGVQGSPLGNAMAGVSRPLQSATPSQIAVGLSKTGGKRGGSAYGSSFNPTAVSGMGNGSGAGLQLLATNH